MFYTEKEIYFEKGKSAINESPYTRHFSQCFFYVECCDCFKLLCVLFCARHL